MDEEDTRRFSNMLDAVAERVFEAYTEKVAAESSTVSVPQSKPILQHSPILQQGKEFGPELSLKTGPFPSESSCSLDEPINRRKRSRTCEQPSWQQLVSANQFNPGFSDKNPSLERENHFVSWPQNFTFQTYAENKSVGGFESSQSSFLVKDHRQLPKKSPSRTQRSLSNNVVSDLDRTNVGSEKKEVEKSVDFSKEIEDAISRIESLIPSLQKLVCSVHSPKQKRVDILGLPKFSGSVNPTGKEMDRVMTRNEISLTEKSAALGETTVGNQVGQMRTKCNLPVPSRVKWSTNVNRVDDNDDDMLKEIKSTEIERNNVNKIQRMVDKPFNFNAQNSQVPGPKIKVGMGESKSLKDTRSRNGSFASQNPVHIQGSRIMPFQSSCEETIEKDVTSRPCSQVPSVGSTNYMRRNRTSMGDPSQQIFNPSHTMMPREPSNRNVTIMKNMKEASHGKTVSDDQTSEDTSWSSCASSSATTQQSDSQFSSSGTYQSSGTDYYDSDESEPQHERVGRSTRRKQAEVATESSASGYDTNSSSYYNSRDDYSDVGSSSQMSSAVSHEWDRQKARGTRRGGKLRRLGRKLGLIFHHHHHHHHHYRDEDEPDAHHARSIWTRLGEMFQHTKNDNDYHHKQKTEKPRKSEIKTLAKRKQQGGHFHTLVGGLMRHVKHSKKPKQVKNGMKGLGKGRHAGKKLPWLPKIHGGKGGKGNAKLGNYRSKSMAAAKIILGK